MSKIIKKNTRGAEKSRQRKSGTADRRAVRPSAKKLPPSASPAGLLDGTQPAPFSSEKRAVLTTAEIAARFGMNPVSVSNLAKRGAFPNAFLERDGRIRRYLIPVADVDRYFRRAPNPDSKKGPTRL